MRTDFSKNAIIRKSIDFSICIISYVEKLEEHKKHVIARQLLKSATSIGANAMEAQSAESKIDFIHKLKIADKEAHETLYWLILCKESQSYPFEEGLLQKLEEIMKLLNAIIYSSKNKSTSRDDITLSH